MKFYQKLIKPVAFKINPETTHDLAINLGKFLGKFYITKKLIKLIYYYENKKLENKVLGINFKNPVGLAAGFDKNGVITDILSNIGFGFMEIGSITAEPCKGNKKPRLWRLPKDNSLVVNYGLSNEGSKIISKRLKNKKLEIPTFISVAKTNDPKIKGKDSIEDYYKGFSSMKNIGDFITINISCPNTGDGKTFEDPKLLDKLLKRINNKNILLKLSPDLTKNQVDKILKVVNKYKIQGFVIGNLTKNRNNLKSSKQEINKTKGGLSGLPTKNKSNNLIKYVYTKTKGKYVIIGVGGIFTAEDAYEKIKNGASLVELITGLIYNGPSVAKEINKGLVKLLEKDKYKNIKEVIGKN